MNHTTVWHRTQSVLNQCQKVVRIKEWRILYILYFLLAVRWSCRHLNLSRVSKVSQAEDHITTFSDSDDFQDFYEYILCLNVSWYSVYKHFGLCLPEPSRHRSITAWKLCANFVALIWSYVSKQVRQTKHVHWIKSIWYTQHECKCDGCESWTLAVRTVASQRDSRMPRWICSISDVPQCW